MLSFRYREVSVRNSSSRKRRSRLFRAKVRILLHYSGKADYANKRTPLRNALRAILKNIERYRFCRLCLLSFFHPKQIRRDPPPSEFEYYYFVPVEPKPPVPRSVSERLSASSNSTRKNGVMTSWAILSPSSISCFSVEWLCRATMISPR